MAELVAGIRDIVVSGNHEDCLKTYALGSCVAVIMYAPALKVAALAHVALPDSALAGNMTSKKPGYFADTSIPGMIRRLKKFGVKNHHQVWVKLIGGANMLEGKDHFNIGKRNVLAVKKHLWKYRLGAIAEDVGGQVSRTVLINVATGSVVIYLPQKVKRIL